MNIKKQFKDLKLNTERKNISICFLAPANNAHTQKWCKWFYEKGYNVHLISFIEGNIDNIDIHIIGHNSNTGANDFQKLRYLTLSKQVKRTLQEINPDIISVHFASSYGTVAALSGLRGYTLSVWGTDIFGFPKKSILHKLLLQFSLRSANKLLATSKALAKETNKYTRRQIEITPFGVDTTLFRSIKDSRDKNRFTVGTVKALTPLYGIDYLIKAVALISKEYPEIPIELRIIGIGEKEDEYKSLARQLGIENRITWLGYLTQKEVADEWNIIDLGVLYSAKESFGVSALEAQACGVPLVVSDALGFLESTSPGCSSIVVPFGDETKLAERIVDLYNAEEKRREMGIAGRNFVISKYEINECFKRIEKCLLA